MDYETYKKYILKFINNHDTREINFQNDVIKKFLETVFEEYDVVSVDTKGCDTNNHDYLAYSGMYKDDNNKLKPTTPDLLICKNWDWYNKENKNIKYFATIEVKSPFGSEAIYKKDFKDYPEKWKEKIVMHLSAREIKHVIFTDTFKWVFLKENIRNLIQQLNL